MPGDPAEVSAGGEGAQPGSVGLCRGKLPRGS